jgi:hypothetical protein
MSSYAKSASPRLIATGLSVGLLCATTALSPAQDAGKAGRPDFSGGNAGWVTIGTDWTPVPGSPPPVGSDPAHPYVPNNTGAQPTFRLADVNNPNLTQFAKEALKKANDEMLGGKAMYSRESRCWATGVPSYLLNPGGPTFFIQSPQEVTMIWQMDHQVRHVYLNVPHSANPKPSWYGESVGHYESDTLVVDTIGQNTQTFLDNYRTPHSEKLHVIERFRLINDGKGLEVRVTMEDPATFVEPVQVVHRWRRVQGPIIESTCAEGEMNNPFKQDTEPLPRADRADF